MKTKLTSLITLTCFIALVCVPGPAFAGVDSIIQQSISASGTLTLTSTLNVTGGPLTFTGNAQNLAVTAPGTITVEFDGASAAYQAVVITTNNTNYTGSLPGQDGMIGDNTDHKIPLFWTVFDSFTEANIYEFDVYAPNAQIPNPNYIDPVQTPNEPEYYNVGGQIDPTYQPYVVNGTPDTLSTGDPDPDDNELSYASAIWDISGIDAKLADFPYNASGGHTSGDPRTVDDGKAYLKFATDYHNVLAQNYSTTIYLDLITVS